MSFNKKEALIYFVLFFLSQTGLTQQIYVESSKETGRRFLKRVEYNFRGFGCYNFESKTDIEKMFFGDFNSPVEFFIMTSSEHEEGPYGFRVFKDSLKTGYIIESKRITNWRTVLLEMAKKFPGNSDQRRRESLDRYETISQSLPVNNLFAEKMHQTIVAAIDTFAGKGEPAVIKDGYYATFRCVVQDEVWTFTVQVPQGEFLKLTNLCKQIMADMKTNHFNASDYIALFENLSLKN